MAYVRTTFASLVDRLTERVGNNVTFFLQVEKEEAINEALLIWQAMTGDFVTSFPLPLSGTTTFVDVPRQVVGLQRILFNGVPLSDLSQPELDQGFVGWQGVTGTPLFWAPVGLNKVAFYPSPTSGVLTFEGIAEFPKLRDRGDFIDLGDEEVSAILSYAHHYLTFKEGPTELDSAFAGMLALVGAAGKRNGRVKATSFYKTYMGFSKQDALRPSEVVAGLGVR